MIWRSESISLLSQSISCCLHFISWLLSFLFKYLCFDFLFLLFHKDFSKTSSFHVHFFIVWISRNQGWCFIYFTHHASLSLFFLSFIYPFFFFFFHLCLDLFTTINLSALSLSIFYLYLFSLIPFLSITSRYVNTIGTNHYKVKIIFIFTKANFDSKRNIQGWPFPKIENITDWKEQGESWVD